MISTISSAIEEKEEDNYYLTTTTTTTTKTTTTTTTTTDIIRPLFSVHKTTLTHPPPLIQMPVLCVPQ
jgi:hypothetical protein